MAEITEKDVKIGSKAEALWTRVKNARQTSIEDLEESLIVEKAFLELAEKKVKEEHDKFQAELKK